ncbi:tail protein X [Pelosinus sp. UFO1]|uniref:tail protein X n=1 Tax=Pelosinus sp. UFO1 TaxID=484770 RepID=UPI0004D1BD2F|nr:tail protein X [Pelosinus sp. UFO1]AIF51260.1 tail X family protein [Pelosinus sp. UFO1]
MASTYTTKQGDMWDAIAYKVYGSEHQMHVLMDANPVYIPTVIFPAGVILVVPDIATSQPQNLPPWKRVSI